MKGRLLIALTVGILIGWFIKGYVDSDSCLDAGGRWERSGGYCYGARSAAE